NNLVVLRGTGTANPGAPHFYATHGGEAPMLPTELTVASDPFIRVLQFTIGGTGVTNNLLVNGNFEANDLSRQGVNLTGWQTQDEIASDGYWAIQSSFNSPQSRNLSPLSAQAVTQPFGQRRAMLDAPDVNQRRRSTLGFYTPADGSFENLDKIRST